MKKPSRPSFMVALTIATGILGFPIAYWACVGWRGLTEERLAWWQAVYAAVMLLAAIVGAILDIRFKNKNSDVKIGANFVSVVLFLLFLEATIVSVLSSSSY